MDKLLESGYRHFLAAIIFSHHLELLIEVDAPWELLGPSTFLATQQWNFPSSHGASVCSIPLTTRPWRRESLAKGLGILTMELVVGVAVLVVAAVVEIWNASLTNIMPLIPWKIFPAYFAFKTARCRRLTL
jgi:hypothetical protein